MVQVRLNLVSTRRDSWFSVLPDVRSLEEVPHMQQAYLTDSTPDGLVFRGAPDPLSDWLAFSNLDDCSISTLR